MIWIDDEAYSVPEWYLRGRDLRQGQQFKAKQVKKEGYVLEYQEGGQVKYTFLSKKFLRKVDTRNQTKLNYI